MDLVASKLYQPWISLDRVESMVQIEIASLLLGLVFVVWLVSRLFFGLLSVDRIRTLRALNRNLFFYTIAAGILFLGFHSFNQLPGESRTLHRIITYLGLGSILLGATVFVKACRILVFEYFFLSYRKTAFPVLLVNLISLVISIILATWLAAEIFNIQVGPLLATSAIFSLVLGLALQDTLGNLFAGVALQFDKPYELGDWIEVHSDQKIVTGQVYEITWRATIMISFTREIITVPNRTMAQSKISNFSIKHSPVMRHEYFKLPFGVDIQKVKDALLEAPSQVPLVRTTPSPEVWIYETSESGISFKLVYFIDNFGAKNPITNEVYTHALMALERAGYKLAVHQVALHNVKPN